MTAPLLSWQDGPAKQGILAFVAAVTDPDSPTFVPPEMRIAAFDNDGTLWCEKPVYIQVDYLLRRLAAQAEQDVTLQARQPWQAALSRDYDWLGSVIVKHYEGDDGPLREMLHGILSLAGTQSVEEIEAAALAFVRDEPHPLSGRPYHCCVYQPMLELLQYLGVNDFRSYIVSGSGRDFIRGFAQDLYGIPRDRVIGTTLAYQYVDEGDSGHIVQKGEMGVVDDGPGKPIQIWNVIGRRPILAAGNSNGDIPMLSFAGGGSLPALRLLVDHDDAEREFAYTTGAETAIQSARRYGWSIVSMKNDWGTVFPC